MTKIDISNNLRSFLISIACSETPMGKAKWTLQMLADKRYDYQYERNDVANMFMFFGPCIVQRDYKRIIRTFGTSSPSPKVRGYSSGREKGTKLPSRLRYPTVKKTASKKKTA